MSSRRNWKSFSQFCKPSPHGSRQTSIPSFGILDRLGLHPSPTLIKHGDHGTRAAGCAIQGSDKYLSSSDMYRHLNLLQELVSEEMRTRLEIETILFRVSAMLQGGRHLVFGIRDGTLPVLVPRSKGPRTQELSGTAGYNAYVADSAKKVHLTQQYAFDLNRALQEGLFIAESNRWNLWDRFPHAIAKMYALATDKDWYNVQIVRGAISNGREWAFILLRLNENGKGGTYEVSPPTAIAFGSDYPNHVTNCGPDIVAGVLAHWVEHCYDDLDENDWFKVDTQAADD